MKPEQKIAFDWLMQSVQIAAMRIAEIPTASQRRAAVELASAAATQSAAEHGISDEKIIELFTEGVIVLVGQIVMSGMPTGGHA